jgi:hypothetical protein
MCLAPRFGERIEVLKSVGEVEFVNNTAAMTPFTPR